MGNVWVLHALPAGTAEVCVDVQLEGGQSRACALGSCRLDEPSQNPSPLVVMAEGFGNCGWAFPTFLRPAYLAGLSWGSAPTASLCFHFSSQ